MEGQRECQLSICTVDWRICQEAFGLWSDCDQGYTV